jgi:hypothetical protein
MKILLQIELCDTKPLGNLKFVVLLCNMFKANPKWIEQFKLPNMVCIVQLCQIQTYKDFHNLYSISYANSTYIFLKLCFSFQNLLILHWLKETFQKTWLMNSSGMSVHAF